MEPKYIIAAEKIVRIMDAGMDTVPNGPEEHKKTVMVLADVIRVLAEALK